jgi:acyl-CoA thioesterase-2
VNGRLAELVDLLDLEEIDTDVYRGQNESDREQRLFGGQVAAQALAAAGRSVPDWFPHSLHGYFLRPGDPARPVLYTVDRIRDGRSFATRRVVALQGGRAIFNTAISFHDDERGHEHQLPMPEVPPPEEVLSWPELVDQQRTRLPERVMPWVHRERSIDLRHVQIPSYLGGDPFEGPGMIWFRADGELDDDPLLHQCVITYTSDMSLIDSMVRNYARTDPGHELMTASLDHAIWFHRRTRADEWLLYVQDSPAAAGARGFARGTIFTRDGVLVASVAQEGLMRPTTVPEDRSQ